MLIFTQGEEPGEDFLSELERLGALLIDMARISRGMSPETIAGDKTPVLDRWIITSRLVPCLAGLCTGHPRLPGTNRMICTSDVWLMARDRSWARTLSQWYRLGRPAERIELDS